MLAASSREANSWRGNDATYAGGSSQASLDSSCDHIRKAEVRFQSLAKENRVAGSIGERRQLIVHLAAKYSSRIGNVASSCNSVSDTERIIVLASPQVITAMKASRLS